MTITIKDIARLTGVSTATVSRCLNNSPLIADETKNKINAVIKEYQYSPSSIARSFVNQKTHLIAFIVDSQNSISFGNPFFLQIQYGIEKALSSRGYYLMIVTISSGNRWSNIINNLINERKVDGIILPAAFANKSLWKAVNERNFPCVVIGYLKENMSFSWVDLDNTMGGELATTHLINHGCKNVSFIGSDFNEIFVTQRLEGYKSALRKRNIHSSSDLIYEGYDGKDKGREIMTAILSEKNHPDGFVFSDNITAYGALYAALDKGVKIPTEIQIVSFDNTDIARLSNPEMTVVDVDMLDLGSQAAMMLIKQLEAPSLNRQQSMISVKLICRGTTKND